MNTGASTAILAGGAPTLGLTGPRFLVVYLVLVAACTGLALFWRYRVYADASAGGPTPEPGAYRSLSTSELAYLAGGPRRALLTAVGTLIDRGIIRDDSRPIRPVTPQDELDPLQWRVADTLMRTSSAGYGREAPVAGFDALRDAATEEFDALRSGLEVKGLAYTPATHKRAQQGRYLLWACSALLVFRFVTGLVNHRPVFLLFVLLFGTAVAMVVVGKAKSGPPAVGRVLKKAREDMAHLAPEYRPAYRSYGQLAYPAAVALFGIAVIEVTFPTLSAQPAVAAMGLRGTTSGADGFSSGCSSSTSSCSSSCSSGGDSGGGGCGGGGCGGCGGGS